MGQAEPAEMGRQTQTGSKSHWDSSHLDIARASSSGQSGFSTSIALPDPPGWFQVSSTLLAALLVLVSWNPIHARHRPVLGYGGDFSWVATMGQDSTVAEWSP